MNDCRNLIQMLLNRFLEKISALLANEFNGFPMKLETIELNLNNKNLLYVKIQSQRINILNFELWGEDSKGQFEKIDLNIGYRLIKSDVFAIVTLDEKRVNLFKKINIKITTQSKNLYLNDLVLIVFSKNNDHNVMLDQGIAKKDLCNKFRNLFLFGNDNFNKDSTCTEVYEALQNIFIRNIGSINSIAFSGIEDPIVRRRLNSILMPFELEINAHGIKRTFRYWNDEEKKSYLEFCNEVTGSLLQISKHVCLGFGFVLGYKRSNSLIKHDDDLDILVAFDLEQVPSISDALSAVRNQLEDDGFRVFGEFFSHLWVQEPKTQLTLDVFVGLREGDKLSFYPSERNSLRFKDVFPAQSVIFNDLEIRLPRRIENYLSKTYGSSWREEDSYFQHKWDRSQYKDIEGRRIKEPQQTKGEIRFLQRLNR